MNTRSFILPIIIVLGMGLSGCASTPTNGTEPRSKDDQARTKTEGVALGALLGAVLGAAVGDDDRAVGALIGATVGAGAGYLVGQEIAKRKKKYATEEEFLDSEIASAREFNLTAATYNASLEQDIARMDKETIVLKNQYEADQVSYSQLEKERVAIAKKIESSESVMQELREEQKIKLAIHEEQLKKRSSNDARVIQLEQELDLLKENIDTLNQHSQQLARIDDRLSR